MGVGTNLCAGEYSHVLHAIQSQIGYIFSTIWFELVTGSREMRNLTSLQDKVADVHDPLSRLLDELEGLRDALRPIHGIAQTVAQQQKVQEDRERY